MFFQVTLPALTASGGDVAWVKSLGHQLINNVNLEIGGQEIDKHYSDWLEIWSQLTVPAGQRNGYNKMIGNTPDLTGDGLTTTPTKTLYIPLNQTVGETAVCCDNIGLLSQKTHCSTQDIMLAASRKISCKIPSRWNTLQHIPYQARSEMIWWPACKLGEVRIGHVRAISVPGSSRRYGKSKPPVSQTGTVLVDNDKLTL